MTHLPRIAALSIAATMLTLAAAPSEAATVNFNFDATDGFASTNGAGSFTTDIASGAVTLKQLSAFSLKGSADAFFVSGGYSFGLKDLTSFSTTLSNGLVSALSFTTTTKQFAISAFGFLPLGRTNIQLAVDGVQPGNLTVTNSFVGSVTGDFNVPVAAPISAVPEPATWAMMIGGFGMAGGAMRRRKANVTTRVAFN